MLWIKFVAEIESDIIKWTNILFNSIPSWTITQFAFVNAVWYVVNYKQTFQNNPDIGRQTIVVSWILYNSSFFLSSVFVLHICVLCALHLRSHLFWKLCPFWYCVVEGLSWWRVVISEFLSKLTLLEENNTFFHTWTFLKFLFWWFLAVQVTSVEKSVLFFSGFRWYSCGS